MKCPKCNADNANDVKFCGECGYDFSTIVEKNNDHYNQPTNQEISLEKKEIKSGTFPSSKKNIWIKIFVIVICVALLTGLLIPYKTITRTENVPYEATEEYSVREPFSGIETYYEEVPYQDEECEDIYPSFNRDQDMEWVNGMVNVICTITNFETEPIRVQYELYTKNEDGDTVDSYGPYYVTIGSGQTVKKDALLTSGGRYGCSAVADRINECKTVTKFKSIEKERATTTYQNVVKTRTITKIRTDNVHTQVNWLFGIKMPWLAEWRIQGESIYYDSIN